MKYAEPEVIKMLPSQVLQLDTVLAKSNVTQHSSELLRVDIKEATWPIGKCVDFHGNSSTLKLAEDLFMHQAEGRFLNHSSRKAQGSLDKPGS
ncbi:hypothetical protein N7453_009028 [Penicillium expansum]|nr:hypothetical protein N7453_009028 [Penicillium expansum]